MQIADIPGIRGKEQEIIQSWEDEAVNSGIRLKFDGETVYLLSIREGKPTDWQVESLRRTFQLAVHRVLPDVKITWR
jgi:hypothetical protein